MARPTQAIPATTEISQSQAWLGWDSRLSPGPKRCSLRQFPPPPGLTEFKTRPFYKSAATIRLQKPPEDESVEFVKSRFASCGMGIDDKDAKRIVAESENVPYYIQQLSSLVFDRLAGLGRDWVDASDIDASEDDVLAENADYYVERMATLSMSQRLVVRAIANERTAVFTEAYRRRHSLGASSTVHTALKAAIDAGIVESGVDGYSLEDPFFARYLRLSAARGA